MRRCDAGVERAHVSRTDYPKPDRHSDRPSLVTARGYYPAGRLALWCGLHGRLAGGQTEQPRESGWAVVASTQVPPHSMTHGATNSLKSTFAFSEMTTPGAVIADMRNE